MVFTDPFSNKKGTTYGTPAQASGSFLSFSRLPCGDSTSVASSLKEMFSCHPCRMTAFFRILFICWCFEYRVNHKIIPPIFGIHPPIVEKITKRSPGPSTLTYLSKCDLHCLKLI